MSRYHVSKGAHSPRKPRIPHRVLWLVLALLVAGLIGSIVVRHKYDESLKPESSSQTTSLFTVAAGSSVNEIASNLQKKHLIRSAWALELYVHSKEIGSKLQAGTYAFSPSETTQHIVLTLTKGQVSTSKVTILPGERIDQIRADLINDGYAPSTVDAALNPAQYANLPVLSFKPAAVTNLEGLLWPDTFLKDNNTNLTAIITQSLDETAQHLGSDVQSAFASEGLTTYQGLILASIITKEVSKPSDQPQVAQVFLTRLKMGMMLGSDVTAMYGSVKAGLSPRLTYDSPYNTLIHTGLPPTPISTITAGSLNAATHPSTSTSWIYFVAGDDGTTYFSNTLQEHQANTAKYCHKLCGQ
jgi:UPF0755 protein